MKSMLKKGLILLAVGGLLTVLLLAHRINSNPEDIFPRPYHLKQIEPINNQAKILFIGDRMGHYLSQFLLDFNDTLSQDLDHNIEVSSLADEKYPLHRMIAMVKEVTPWPQIFIYQGASQFWQEKLYIEQDRKKIKANFDRYNNSHIQSLLLLYPPLSKVIYEPLDRVRLEDSFSPKTQLTFSNPDHIEIHYQLFEEHIKELISLARDKNSLLILTTTPIDIFQPPKKTCPFIIQEKSEQQLARLKRLISKEDYKSAFAFSQKVLDLNPAHSEIYYYSGLAAFKSGELSLGQKLLLQSSGFDCGFWRSNHVYNSIIRKVASQTNTILFDFAKMVLKERKQESFIDDLYPQSSHYQKAVRQLAKLVKRILKL